MRLRLRCSSVYTLGDFQWSMVHVPEHVVTVRDLASHACRLLELSQRGGGSELPQFMLEGFLVPYGEQLRDVLRDDEVVDVLPSQGMLAALTAAPHSDAVKRPAAAAAAAAIADRSPAATARANAFGGAASSAAKKPRIETSDNGPAMMALGWQPQERHTPASSGKDAAHGKQKQGNTVPVTAKLGIQTATRTAQESSSDSEDAPVKAPSGGGSAKPLDATAAATAARAAAMATCSSASAPTSAGSQGKVASNGQEGKGIFVGGVSVDLTSDAVRKHFERFGPVESAEVALAPNGKPKGFAFVEFGSCAAREAAVAAGKQELGGKLVEVKPRVSKPDKGAGKSKHDSQGKSKGGVKGKGKHSEPKVKVLQPPSSSSSESEEEPASKPAGASQAAPAPELNKEELDLQKQMAALGLPVSFTANADRNEDEDSDDEDEDEEDEAE